MIISSGIKDISGFVEVYGNFSLIDNDVYIRGEDVQTTGISIIGE
jgi:hypothetical protein